MPSKPEFTTLKGIELIHGDTSRSPEVAPSISVTTTFRAPKETINLSEWDPTKPALNVYSRYSQDVSTRAEEILSKINNGHALTYASGLAASYAALVHYQPKCIAISEGYHGCHATIAVYRKDRSVKVIGIDDDFEEGTLCWLETPLNPTGESRNIEFYADKVHAAKGVLVVDSTFAPPPLQYPFKWGADCVMHSGTKYFGGHSDLLCGILVVKTVDEWKKLWGDRTFLGNMMGSLESWLLLRSLRTLHLRVARQSQTATAFAQWLDRLAQIPVGQEWDGVQGGLVKQVHHSSLQARTADWAIDKQMEGGWNATFSFLLTKKEHASLMPHIVKYLVPATSLGGVESLIEQRVTADPATDPRLIRISIGVEDLEDLKADFRRAFNLLVQEKAKL
ncbi:hypothetical protein M0805_006124 [Coniferiporia weirii]|nr:hypothetical protein M0805_006124 [Coniferiporia weirii]